MLDSQNVGVKNIMGVDFPEWTPEVSLEQMEKNQIKITMFSTPAPGVYVSEVEIQDAFFEEFSRIANAAVGVDLATSQFK